jgi:hypothetical protein
MVNATDWGQNLLLSQKARPTYLTTGRALTRRGGRWHDAIGPVARARMRGEERTFASLVREGDRVEIVQTRRTSTKTPVSFFSKDNVEVI